MDCRIVTKCTQPLAASKHLPHLGSKSESDRLEICLKGKPLHLELFAVYDGWIIEVVKCGSDHLNNGSLGQMRTRLYGLPIRRGRRRSPTSGPGFTTCLSAPDFVP